MSRPAPLDTAELPLHDFDTRAAVQRRRLNSQRVRRRRLLVADLGIGAALGLLCLLLTPGLAIAALVALIALAVYGAVVAAAAVSRRRARRRRSSRDDLSEPARAPAALPRRMEGTVSAAASWPALGSTAVLRVEEPEALDDAVALVVRELARFDEACSRFREDSELSILNARAGRPVEVGPLLLDAIELALRGARLTDGALDPTIGLSLEQAGYDRDWELLRELPDPGEDADAPPRLIARRRGGWHQVVVDRAGGNARIPAGTKLDLGATAKALAADRSAALVHSRLGCGVLVALGGDVATAGAAPARGWEVHVTDDHRDGPDAPGQRLAISDGGLATSSTTTRRWRRGGESMHHIIDPHTGRPAQTPWRTVSVAAADCVDANIASTGALLAGTQAPGWLRALGLPARLVGIEGRVVKVGDWPVGGEHRAVMAEVWA